ncbi:unnamed protein product [Scytosiphon promiscuus]
MKELTMKVPAALLALLGTMMAEPKAMVRSMAEPTAEGSPRTLQTNLPTGIVIISQGRSGSTLMGALFRQQQDMLYFYEPCRGLRRDSRDEVLDPADCFALASRLVKCEFSPEDVKWLGFDEGAMWMSSSVVKDTTIATGRRSQLSREDDIARAYKTLMTACRSSRGVVVKTIRAYDGVLRSPEHDTSGVHVLHLVRDPRGVVNSQMVQWNLDHFANILPNYEALRGIQDPDEQQVEAYRTLGYFICRNYRKQLDSSQEMGDGSKYLLLKYEDFTVLPQLVTAYIYSFFGLGEVPSNVKGWIDENTKLPSCETKNVTAVDCNKDASAGNPYSTKRNSANMANLWRSQVPEERSKAVWDACQASGVMEDLGYEL